MIQTARISKNPSQRTLKILRMPPRISYTPRNLLLSNKNLPKKTSLISRKLPTPNIFLIRSRSFARRWSNLITRCPSIRRMTHLTRFSMGSIHSMCQKKMQISSSRCPKLTRDSFNKSKWTDILLQKLAPMMVLKQSHLPLDQEKPIRSSRPSRSLQNSPNWNNSLMSSSNQSSKIWFANHQSNNWWHKSETRSRVHWTMWEPLNSSAMNFSRVK